MRIVIALGGNALGQTPEKQKENAYITAKHIIPIIKSGHEVIITHGNGPQVGLINLAFEEGGKINNKVYKMPFSECGAMSQGYIGYHLQNALNNEFQKMGISKSVISVCTQVEVAVDDPAFKNPTKPIGSFYSKEEAIKMMQDNSNLVMKEDAGRGYRRVVASPKPVKVLEEKAVEDLVKMGYIVITCGGGGIPVIKKDDKYVGVDAVIDKDYASSKLASTINSDCLLILTAVDQASINFNQPNQIDLGFVNSQEMIKYNEEGHFLSGSMKPKVEACLEFLKNKKDGLAIITSIEKANDAINGLAGTRIRNN